MFINLALTFYLQACFIPENRLYYLSSPLSVGSRLELVYFAVVAQAAFIF